MGLFYSVVFCGLWMLLLLGSASASFSSASSGFLDWFYFSFGVTHKKALTSASEHYFQWLLLLTGHPITWKNSLRLPRKWQDFVCMFFARSAVNLIALPDIHAFTWTELGAIFLRYFFILSLPCLERLANFMQSSAIPFYFVFLVFRFQSSLQLYSDLFLLSRYV